MQISEMKYLAPLGKSDHSMIVFDFHCYVDYKKPKATFKYHKADYDAIRVDTAWTDWLQDFQSLSLTNNTEDMWNSLKNKLIDIRSKFIPQNKVEQVLCWNSKHHYPLSKETRSAIKEKNKLHRKWISSLQNENRLKYVRMRNKVNFSPER